MTIRMLDAQQALGFVTSQTSYIETEVNKIVYADIQYPALVPVDTSAPDWIKSVTYYSGDMYGKADWINGNADDVPKAGTERTKFETGVYTAGIGYGYGLEEISQASMLGINLSSDDAAAARRAYEEVVERVALLGDASKGFQGLFNNSAVTAGSATTGNWATATPAQILGDVNNALTGIGTGTLWTRLANTLLLPQESYNILATRMVSDLATETILSWLLRNNVYTAQTGQPLLIRGQIGLSTAGSGSTKRMVAYFRDPSVLKMHIPMPHRFLPVYQSGPLRWDVPGIFRLGGLDIRAPKQVSYTDGL